MVAENATKKKETKEERFKRLAEARVNKILAMIRLLGNLSYRNIYAYTDEQVAQIFDAIQTETQKAKHRILESPEGRKKHFSLSVPMNEGSENQEDTDFNQE